MEGILNNFKKTKKKKILSVYTACMKLEAIMPSKINYAQKNKCHMVLLT